MIMGKYNIILDTQPILVILSNTGTNHRGDIMKPKFYLVMDQTIVLGYGKTKEAAIRDAEEWLPDPEDLSLIHISEPTRPY